MILILQIATISLLAFVTLLYGAAYIRQLVRDPSGLLPLMLDGFGLGVLWVLVTFPLR